MNTVTTPASNAAAAGATGQPGFPQHGQAEEAPLAIKPHRAVHHPKNRPPDLNARSRTKRTKLEADIFTVISERLTRLRP